jgi:hypothetical protein
LGVFGREVGDFEDADVQVVQALADVAAIGLLPERAISRSEALTEQLQGGAEQPDHHRAGQRAIAQAHNVTVDVAFELIRAYAHSNNRRLSERSTEAWPTRESAISSAVLSRD